MTTEHPGQLPDPRLLNAVLRYLDGHSSPDEVSGLARQLRADPERGRQMARLLISVGHLRDLDEAAFAGDRLAADAAGIPRLDPSSSRGRSRRIVTAAVALAVAAAVVLVVRLHRDRSQTTLAEAPGERVRPAAAAPGRRSERFRPVPPVVPVVAAGELQVISGTVMLVEDGQRAPARAGMKLASGAGLESPDPFSLAVAALADGSRVDLEGEAQLLAVEAGPAAGAGDKLTARLMVERGNFTVTTSVRSGQLRLVTPLSEIVVEGQLRLAVKADETRIDVRRGQAAITRLSDGQQLVVTEQASALITEAGALRAQTLPRALFVRGLDTGMQGALDRKLAAQIEAAGLTVLAVPDAELGPLHLLGKALVVISSTTSGAVLPERLLHVGLREAPVPVVSCENTSFVPLGMATRAGAAPNVSEAWIEASDHPLAASRTGRIGVAEAPIVASWGQPSSAARRIVSLNGRRRVAVFAYEQGAAMVGGAAPARRASCFLNAKGVTAVSEAGWDLFAAAVRWAVAR
jgi:hypothetical protein